MIRAQANPASTVIMADYALQESAGSDGAPGLKIYKNSAPYSYSFQSLSEGNSTGNACVLQVNCSTPVAQNSNGVFTALLPSLVSATLVVVGWYVVNKAQSNRERRKQIREYVSDLCDSLAELEALTIGYHTAPREEAKEQEIITKLGRFERACSTLPRFLQSQKYLKAVPLEKIKIDGKRLQILRKAMTLAHFGDEHTLAFSRQDPYILTLELAYVEMQEELERVRIDSLD